MNAVMTFLPYFILVLVIVFLVNKYSNKKRLTVKVTHWLFIVYVTVLLIASFTAPFFINQKLTYKEWHSKAEIEDSWVNYNKVLEEGQINRIKHVLKSSSFEYDEPTLELNFDQMDYSRHVYVERKDSDDNNIEVRILASGVYINGFDFTDQIKPPTFSLHGNTLSMARTLNDEQFSPDYSSMYDINVAIVKNEFSVTQFSEDGVKIFDSMDNGGTDIYLKIPLHLEITNEADYEINYVFK